MFAADSLLVLIEEELGKLRVLPAGNLPLPLSASLCSFPMSRYGVELAALI